jgi:hypothetical protein
LDVAAYGEPPISSMHAWMMPLILYTPGRQHVSRSVCKLLDRLWQMVVESMGLGIMVSLLLGRTVLMWYAWNADEISRRAECMSCT